jgi:RNA polymerase sigma factor (sigma-70 family)
MTIKADITERDLVEACLARQPKAEELLYKKYSPVLFAICLRYSNNSENAKDMLQESFVKIFERLKDFRFEGSFEGWIKRLSVNHCLDFNKKIRSEPWNEELEDHTGIHFNEEVHSNLQTQDLIGLLQRLPMGYRTVFNLYAIEGYGHQDIAEIMGITESTSKTQLFKARKMLQEWVQKIKS